MYDRFRAFAMDFATAVIVVIAGWIALQPGGLLRTRWDNFRKDGATRIAAATNWPEIVAAGARLYDAEGLPILVEVADYECYYCRLGSPAVDSAVAGGARIALLLVSRTQTEVGRRAVLASLCADTFGRFPAMHRRLMSSEGWKSDSVWENEARALGIRDIAGFLECMDAEATSDRLAKHADLAARLQLRGTPSFVSPEEVIRGAVPAETLISHGATE